MKKQDIDRLASEFESFLYDDEKDFREFFNSEFETKVSMVSTLFMKADEIFSKKLDSMAIIGSAGGRMAMGSFKVCLAGFALGFLSGLLFNRKSSFEEFCEFFRERLKTLSDDEVQHMKKSFGILLGFVTEEMVKDVGDNTVVIEDKLNMQ